MSIKCKSQHFDIGGIRSGQFCDRSIISEWEKIEKRLFWTKTILSTLKQRVTGRIDTQNRKIVTSDPLYDPKVISGHERSPAVFRQYLLKETSQCDENTLEVFRTTIRID